MDNLDKLILDAWGADPTEADDLDHMIADTWGPAPTTLGAAAVGEVRLPKPVPELPTAALDGMRAGSANALVEDMPISANYFDAAKKLMPRLELGPEDAFLSGNQQKLAENLATKHAYMVMQQWGLFKDKRYTGSASEKDFNKIRGAVLTNIVNFMRPGTNAEKAGARKIFMSRLLDLADNEIVNRQAQVKGTYVRPEDLEKLDLYSKISGRIRATLDDQSRNASVFDELDFAIRNKAAGTALPGDDATADTIRLMRQAFEMEIAGDKYDPTANAAPAMFKDLLGAAWSEIYYDVAAGSLTEARLSAMGVPGQFQSAVDMASLLQVTHPQLVGDYRKMVQREALLTQYPGATEPQIENELAKTPPLADLQEHAIRTYQLSIKSKMPEVGPESLEWDQNLLETFEGWIRTYGPGASLMFKAAGETADIFAGKTASWVAEKGREFGDFLKPGYGQRFLPAEHAAYNTDARERERLFNPYDTFSGQVQNLLYGAAQADKVEKLKALGLPTELADMVWSQSHDKQMDEIINAMGVGIEADHFDSALKSARQTFTAYNSAPNFEGFKQSMYQLLRLGGLGVGRMINEGVRYTAKDPGRAVVDLGVQAAGGAVGDMLIKSVTAPLFARARLVAKTARAAKATDILLREGHAFDPLRKFADKYAMQGEEWADLLVDELDYLASRRKVDIEAHAAGRPVGIGDPARLADIDESYKRVQVHLRALDSERFDELAGHLRFDGALQHYIDNPSHIEAFLDSAYVKMGGSVRGVEAAVRPTLYKNVRGALANSEGPLKVDHDFRIDLFKEDTRAEWERVGTKLGILDRKKTNNLFALNAVAAAEAGALPDIRLVKMADAQKREAYDMLMQQQLRRLQVHQQWAEKWDKITGAKIARTYDGRIEQLKQNIARNDRRNWNAPSPPRLSADPEMMKIPLRRLLLTAETAVGEDELYNAARLPFETMDAFRQRMIRLMKPDADVGELTDVKRVLLDDVFRPIGRGRVTIDQWEGPTNSAHRVARIKAEAKAEQTIAKRRAKGHKLSQKQLDREAFIQANPRGQKQYLPGRAPTHAGRLIRNDSAWDAYDTVDRLINVDKTISTPEFASKAYMLLSQFSDGSLRNLASIAKSSALSYRIGLQAFRHQIREIERDILRFTPEQKELFNTWKRYEESFASLSADDIADLKASPHYQAVTGALKLDANKNVSDVLQKSTRFRHEVIDSMVEGGLWTKEFGEKMKGGYVKRVYQSDLNRRVFGKRKPGEDDFDSFVSSLRDPDEIDEAPRMDRETAKNVTGIGGVQYLAKRHPEKFVMQVLDQSGNSVSRHFDDAMSAQLEAKHLYGINEFSDTQDGLTGITPQGDSIVIRRPLGEVYNQLGGELSPDQVEGLSLRDMLEDAYQARYLNSIAVDPYVISEARYKALTPNEKRAYTNAPLPKSAKYGSLAGRHVNNKAMAAYTATQMGRRAAGWLADVGQEVTKATGDAAKILGILKAGTLATGRFASRMLVHAALLTRPAAYVVQMAGETVNALGATKDFRMLINRSASKRARQLLKTYKDIDLNDPNVPHELKVAIREGIIDEGVIGAYEGPDKMSQMHQLFGHDINPDNMKGWRGHVSPYLNAGMPGEFDDLVDTLERRIDSIKKHLSKLPDEKTAARLIAEQETLEGHLTSLVMRAEKNALTAVPFRVLKLLAGAPESGVLRDISLPLGQLYQNVANWRRAQAYFHMLDTGISPEQAAFRVNTFMQTYGRSAEWVQKFKRAPFSSPFVGFPIEQARITAAMIKENPGFLAGSMSALMAFNVSAMAASGLDPLTVIEEMEADGSPMPAAIRLMGSLTLPGLGGEPMMRLDITNALPISAFFGGRGPVPFVGRAAIGERNTLATTVAGGVMDSITSLVGNHPLANPLIMAATGVDVVNGTYSTEGRLGKAFDAATQSLLPHWTPVLGQASQQLTRVLDNPPSRYNKPAAKMFEVAMSNLMGFKPKFNPEINAAMEWVGRGVTAAVTGRPEAFTKDQKGISFNSQDHRLGISVMKALLEGKPEEALVPLDTVERDLRAGHLLMKEGEEERGRAMMEDAMKRYKAQQLELRRVSDPRVVAEFSDADVDNWVRNEIANNDIPSIYSRLAAHEKANAVLYAQTLQVSDEGIADMLNMMMFSQHYEFRGITKASNMRAAHQTLLQARDLTTSNRQLYDTVLNYLKKGAEAAVQLENLEARKAEMWAPHEMEITP